MFSLTYCVAKAIAHKDGTVTVTLRPISAGSPLPLWDGESCGVIRMERLSQEGAAQFEAGEYTVTFEKVYQ